MTEDSNMFAYAIPNIFALLHSPENRIFAAQFSYMRPKLYAKKLCIVILVCISSFCKSQTSITCKDFRTGNFYAYPKNAADRSVIVRDEKTQKETNPVNGDSILWKIDWKGDCSYKLKYISGGKTLPKE